MRIGSHPQRRAERAMRAFTETHGAAAAWARAAFIGSLPIVEWKGQRLYTLRCHGTTGRGPHDVNVPEALLWTLIEPTTFRCPFHT